MIRCFIKQSFKKAEISCGICAIFGKDIVSFGGAVFVRSKKRKYIHAREPVSHVSDVVGQTPDEMFGKIVVSIKQR